MCCCRGFRTPLLIVCALFAFALSGCGKYTGEVKGTVTYKGKPLQGGIVTFVHPDGRIGQSQIQEDGSYSVLDAPGGDTKVTVTTIPPIPGIPSAVLPKGMESMKSEAIYPAGKYVKIPAKWGDPDKTPLTFTVKRGTQPYDIAITD